MRWLGTSGAVDAKQKGEVRLRGGLLAFWRGEAVVLLQRRGGGSHRMVFW